MASKTTGSILSVSRSILVDPNVRIIALTSLVSGVYISMISTVLQQFTLSVGLGLVALGTLQALGGRFGGLTSSLIQPFAGHYADVFGRRVVILLGSLVTIATMMLFLAAALTQSWQILTAAFLLFGISALSGPASQAVVAESVQMDPTKMGIAFSAIFLLASIPGVVMPLVTGILADAYGYYLVFAIAAALETADLLLYVEKLKETKPENETNGGSSAERGFSFRSAVNLPKGFNGIFAAMAMDSFAFGITISIIYGMIVEKFGYSNADIGLMVGAVNLATILAQYPATKLLLVVGPRKSLAISELLGVFMMAGYMLGGSVAFFVVVSILFGVAVATWVPAQQQLIMTYSPPSERGSIGGKMAAYRVLVAFPSPVIGGILYVKFGYFAPGFASMVLAVVTTAMILKLIPGNHAPKEVTSS